MAASYHILCTGDVHLGRHPARVPVQDNALTVEHVWQQAIDTAIRRNVNAVVLTGDLVDRENKMYEAFGTLQRGVERLTEAGIDVVAVAGNHDFDTFPRLADALDAPRFYLLGRGGQWDSVALPEASPQVRFVGWSFPDAHMLDAPVETLDLPATAEPTIGVMHADAGTRQSRYAPVSRRALARTPVDAWLLGHLHTPADHWEGDQFQLYPGSLQPLDPGEPGAHGPWIITVDPEGGVEAQAVPLATVRYERVTIDVTEHETADAVEQDLLRMLRGRLETAVRNAESTRRLVARLHIEGRTSLLRALEARTKTIRRDLNVHVGEATASIDAVTFDTRPDHDLEALAEGRDAPAVLAQLLLDLKHGRETEAASNLLRDAQNAAQTVHEAPGYDPLRHDPDVPGLPSGEALRSILYQRGLLLLDALHAQSGASG